MDLEPAHHAQVDEIYRGNIRILVERGTWTPPAHPVPGARYTPPAPGTPAEGWAEARAMWSPWDDDKEEPAA